MQEFKPFKEGKVREVYDNLGTALLWSQQIVFPLLTIF